MVAFFLLALILRTYSLSTLPWAFHTDELVNGYVGRFILQNGKDVYGNSWPFFYFDKFGDYRVILPMYIAGVSTFLLGVNEFAVRFPTALFGALAVFPFYALAKLLLKDKKASLFCTFILAILPWHLVLSRATSEGIIGLTVFILALYFILRGIFDKQKNFILASVPFFLITYFLYPPFRLLTPLVLMPLPFMAEKRERKYVVGIIILFVLFTAYVSTTVWGKGRYLQTSLLQSNEVATRIYSQNQGFIFDEGQNDLVIARTFHNKGIGYAREFLSLYLDYFSPDFLFLKGGLPYRYTVPDTGLVFSALIILLAILVVPHRNAGAQKIKAFYVLFLLIAAPLPIALTVDDVPNVNRVLFLIVPLLLLSGVGFIRINEYLGKNKVVKIGSLGFLSALIALEFVYFSHQYVRHTASYKSFLRNDGNRELALFIAENQGKYNKVIVPYYETMPLYYLFYTNNFDASLAGRIKKEIKIDRIGNIEFSNEWCPTVLFTKDNIPAKTLIIDNGECQDRPYLKNVEVIMRKDSTRAYRLYTP